MIGHRNVNLNFLFSKERPLIRNDFRKMVLDVTNIKDKNNRNAKGNVFKGIHF